MAGDGGLVGVGGLVEVEVLLRGGCVRIGVGGLVGVGGCHDGGGEGD